MKFDKPIDELIFQMQNDTDVLGRNRAVNELSRIAQTSAAATTTDREKILAALRRAAGSDKLFYVRRAAVAQLGGIFATANNSAAIEFDTATAQTLLKAAKDANSLVRADAVELLGETNDIKYADFYLSAFNDRSYTVIDKAAVALAKTKSPKAAAALTKLVNTKSWKDRIAIAGLRGLATLNPPRSTPETETVR